MALNTKETVFLEPVNWPQINISSEDGVHLMVYLKSDGEKLDFFLFCWTLPTETWGHRLWHASCDVETWDKCEFCTAIDYFHNK